jgi:hypothetical protein
MDCCLGTVNGRAPSGGGASKRERPIAIAIWPLFHWLIWWEIKTNGKILQEKRPRVDARPYFGTENLRFVFRKSRKNDSTL